MYPRSTQMEYKMKKHLMIATGLAVLSTSAFASKARMTALNQSASFGSFT